MPFLQPNVTYTGNAQALFVPMGAGNVVPGEIIFSDGIEVRGAGILAQNCAIAADGVDGTISAVIDSARVQMRKEVVDVGAGNTALNNIGIAFTTFVDTEDVPLFNLAVGSDSAVLPYKQDTLGLYISNQAETPVLQAVYEVDAIGNLTFQNGAIRVAGGLTPGEGATGEQATFVIANADASYVSVKAPDESRFDIGIGATTGERWTENELSIWSLPHAGAPKEVLHVGATGIAAFPQETVIVGSTGGAKHTEVVSGVEFSGVKMVGADGVSSGVLAYGTGVDAIWPAGQLALQQVGATGVYTNALTVAPNAEVDITNYLTIAGLPVPKTRAVPYVGLTGSPATNIPIAPGGANVDISAEFAVKAGHTYRVSVQGFWQSADTNPTLTGMYVITTGDSSVTQVGIGGTINNQTGIQFDRTYMATFVPLTDSATCKIIATNSSTTETTLFIINAAVPGNAPAVVVEDLGVLPNA
jgi:hypothetical protein